MADDDLTESIVRQHLRDHPGAERQVPLPDLLELAGHVHAARLAGLRGADRSAAPRAPHPQMALAEVEILALERERFPEA